MGKGFSFCLRFPRIPQPPPHKGVPKVYFHAPLINYLSPAATATCRHTAASCRCFDASARPPSFANFRSGQNAKMVLISFPPFPLCLCVLARCSACSIPFGYEIGVVIVELQGNGCNKRDYYCLQVVMVLRFMSWNSFGRCFRYVTVESN